MVTHTTPVVGTAGWYNFDVSISSDNTVSVAMYSVDDVWIDEWTTSIDAPSSIRLQTYTKNGGDSGYPATIMYMDNVIIQDIEPTVVFLYGDANHDGVVSAGDYAAVQSNFGNVGTGILGDANDDGVVSAGDYAAVQANFGNTSGAGVVPEPATISLIVFGGFSLIRRKRKFV